MKILYLIEHIFIFLKFQKNWPKIYLGQDSDPDQDVFKSRILIWIWSKIVRIRNTASDNVPLYKFTILNVVTNILSENLIVTILTFSYYRQIPKHTDKYCQLMRIIIFRMTPQCVKFSGKKNMITCYHDTMITLS
jgi:hypothetical protein